MREGKNISKSKSKRLFCLFGIIAIPMLAILIAYFYSRPIINGELFLSKAPGQVSIKLDENGMPHINAIHQSSAYYAMGYIQAQNRLWQMHFLRMMDQGRLSELFGHKMINFDRMQRGLGFKRLANDTLKTLPDSTVKLLRAYVDGVNDYAESCNILPIEFYLSFTSFEPWTVLDTISVFKRMSWRLSSYYQLPLSNSFAGNLVGEEFASLLSPLTPSARFLDKSLTEYIISEEELKSIGLYLDRGNSIGSGEWIRTNSPPPDVDSREQDLGEMTIDGSNAWIISGKYTLSGKPMLASDPHLSNMMPSLWFLVSLEIKSEGYFGVGSTVPGTPFFLIGRSKYVAWGVTNMVGENTDLYYENENSTHYYYDEKWLKLKTRVENISVRWGRDVEHQVKYTENGLLMEPRYFDANVAKSLRVHQGMLEDKAVSLCWSGFRPRDLSLQGIYLMNHAKNASQVFQAAELVTSTSSNLLFITSEGDIGYSPLGSFPVRDYLVSPHYIKPGWDPKFTWKEFIPYSKYPKILNPKKGYILSTNNGVMPYNGEYPIGYMIQPNARAARGKELIENKINKNEKLTVEYMKTMQIDVHDKYAEIILKPLLNFVNSFKSEVLSNQEINELTSLVESLEVWDYKMSAEGKAPLIYMSWELLMKQFLLSKMIPNESIKFSLIRPYPTTDHFFFSTIYKIVNEHYTVNNEWCENEEWRESKQPCKHLIIRSLYNTKKYITSKVGKLDKNWKWGLAHPMYYPHAPFGNFPILNHFFDHSIPTGGNDRTLNVAVYNEKAGNMRAFHSANMRLIVDLGDVDNPTFKSFISVDTGESGEMLSEFYDNMIQSFIDGKYWEIEIPDRKPKIYETIGELIIKPKYD